MSKEIYISSTPHETRLAIVENDNLTEIYYERENEYTLAGSIYNGKVTRVLPGMQSSFVDIGLDRDAFLYITDFMEEAGDAAEFDGASSDSRRGKRDGAREPGREQGRDRDNGRGEPRSSREPQPRLAEPSDADLFAEAVSSLDPARPASSDSARGERGDRDRNRRGGRNRRDRGGANPDSGNRREGEHPAAAERSAAPIERPAPPADMVSAVDLSAVSATEGAQELGEGAPGADGSRRWRGRRGRRGGRPGESARDTGQSIAAPDRGAQPLTPPTDLESESVGFFSVPQEGLTLHAASTEESTPAPRSEPRAPRGDRQPRAPRGFTPTTSLYQVEETPYGTASEAPAEQPVEPMILPGESLSKYRPGGATPDPSASASLSAPPPVSNFVVSGWDGGMVLPGETIRPRGPRPDARPDSASDVSSRPDRGRSGGRDRDRNRGEDRNRGDRGGRPFREDRPSSISAPRVEAPALISSEPAHESPEIVSAPDNSREDTAPTYLTDPQHIPASHLITPLNTTLVPPPPRPDESPVLAETYPEATERITPEEEFEPTEGSASFRIDPAPPSEYRQSAPPTSEEPATFLPASLDAPEASVLPERTSTDEWKPQHETFETAAAEDLSAPEPAQHDLTSINASGEMQSEPFSLMTQDLVAPSTSAQGEPQSTLPVAADAVAGDQTIPAPYFAPGDGLLEEEELLDEDELPSTPLLSLHGRRRAPRRRDA